MSKNIKGKSINVKRTAFIIAMIIIPLTHFLIFYLYVNFNSIIMAFQKYEGNNPVFTLEHFARFFAEITDAESELPSALGNTMAFFCTGLFLIMPVTWFIAYFLYKKVAGYKFFRVVFFLPSIISAVVLTIIYKDFVGSEGFVSELVRKIGGEEEVFGLLDQNSGYELKAIILYTVWTGFGTNLILLGGAMNRIPEEVLEAGMIDGVGMIRELFQIILPMVWPTMTTLIVFTFVGIFTATGPILLLAPDNGNVYTVSYWIFKRVYKGGSALEYPAAVGLAFTVMAMPIVFGVKAIMEKLQSATEY